MKRNVIIVISIVILIIGVIGIIYGMRNRPETPNDGNPSDNPVVPIDDNNEPNVNKTLEIVDEAEIEVHNFKFSKENDSYFAELEILNKTDKDIDLSDYMIHFYDSNGNELDAVNGGFVGTVPAHVTITSSIEVLNDLSNATKFVIKK